MKPQILRVSSRNNHFQHMEVLKRNREKRSQYGEFVVEGVRSINSALAHGWDFVSLAYSSETELSSWAKTLLAESRAVRHLDFKRELLQELSDKTESSEVLAVVKIPPDDLSRIPPKPKMLVVVFDRPGSPGNLGSALRSCDALGVSGAIITGHAVDLYDPSTIRASVGSLFALPVVRLDSAQQVANWLKDLSSKGLNLEVVGSDEKGSRSLDQHKFGAATLLVLGNETLGMSKSYRELCHLTLSIPMTGSASSLNLSCATSILLYEIARQGRG